MNKISKKIVVLLLLITSFFGINTVKAIDKKIEVTDFSVKDKSGTITVEDPVITDNVVTSNITFNKVGDFVTFKLVLKNNESEKYKIESITDNNSNKNITIDYSFSKNYINKGETSTVEMKLTYKNKLINKDKVSLNDLTIKINLVNEDGKSSEIIINPTTGDAILHYMILLILVLTGLILNVNKKKLKGIKVGSLMIVLSVVLIPFVALANERYEVQIKFNDIDIIGEYETYNITIDPKNGDPVTEKQIKYGDPIGTLPSDPSKEGYTFDKWVDGNGNEVTEDTVITGPIDINAKYNVIKYDITYDLNGGSLPSGKTNPSKYTIEDTITLNNPTKSGYTFTGWTGTGISTETTSVTIPAGSKDARSYVAHYSANENTPYTVIHRYQNLNNPSTYTEESVTEYGKTDTQVTAPRQTRTGFTIPAEQSVTVSGTGDSSVTYTYDRETYAFSITDRTYLDSTSTADGTYPYGTEITLKAQNRPGYTFTWSDGNDNYERTFELEGTTSLTPVYTANTNTKYVVKHYKQKVTLDGYEIADTQNLEGTTDSPITPAVNTYTGFVSPATQSTTINGDGSTVVTYNYDRETYAFSVTDRTYLDPTSTADGTYPYGKEITVKAATKPGYTFTKWSNNETSNPYTFTLEGTVSINPVFEANTNTPYTVLHKKQNLDDLTKYTTADTDNLTGTTDTDATPAVRSYAGFTAPSTQTKNIDGNGNTTFEYLYTRNQYTLTITHPEYVVEDKSGSYYYEDTVSLTAIDRQGYTFVGWSTGENTKTITVNIGDSNITVEPLYTSNTDTTYKVIHKYAKLTSGYDTEEVPGTGTTGDTIPAPRQPRTGFVTPAEQNITITADGQATVTYVYERETYSFSISDRTYLTNSSTENGTYPYETVINLTAVERPGYTFKWSDNVTDYTRSFPLTGNTTDLELIYTANTDTQYTVIHKYAKLTEGYDTEEITGTGTTGDTIPAPRQPRTGFVTPAEQNITITGDGEAKVTYIYDRETYAFSVTDRTYLVSGSTANGTYPYGTTINLTAEDRTGYSFEWSDGETAFHRSFPLEAATTLSTVYTANTYTLTAYANYGSIEATTGWTGTGTSATKTITYNDTYGTLPTATRTGYTLAGWNTAQDGTGTNITSSTQVSTTTNQEIYAQWIINTYTVTFDTDGGSTVPSQTVDHGGHATRPATDPTKTGYIFDDWYEDSNYQTPFDFANVQITSATTIYGKFNLDCNGFDTDSWSTIKNNIESDSSYYPIGCQKEVELDMDNDSTPESYTVRLANTSNPSVCGTSTYSQTACGTVIEFVDIVGRKYMNSSITNVGGWKSTYMVTYLNGDFYNKLPSDLKSVIIPTYPIVSSSGAGEVSPDITNEDPTKNKIYLLSTREVGYDVSYDNKRDITTDTRTLDYYAANNNDEARIKYEISENPYYWALRSAYSGESNFYFYGVYEDGAYCYYRADYTSGVAPAFRIGTTTSYTVTFDTDGGSSIPSQTISYGGHATRPATDPTKTNYTFDNWYADSNYQTLYDFTNETITSATTIYGKFDINTFTVTANANGGSIEATTGWTGTGSTATKDVEYNSAIGTLPEVSKSGYVLAGWNTAQDGTGTNVTASTTVTSALPIYAQWIEAQSMFDTGQNVNAKMKKLAGNSSAEWHDTDTSITAIQKASTKPDTSSFTSDNIVSISNSTYNAPIYAWFDNGTIYWWSEDTNPSLNSNSLAMFTFMGEVTSIELDYFDTSNVTNMKMMFNGCDKLTSLDFSSFDTSNVTTFEMFLSDCSSLASLDLGDNFDTSSAAIMDNMFLNCSSLTSIDFGDKFDTNSVTGMFDMFAGCSSLTSLDLSDFDTSLVTDMAYMFYDCSSLTTLDVSTFNTSNVALMYGMFSGCTNLTTIYATTAFDTSSVTNGSNMFDNSTNIVGGQGTTYNAMYIDETYAHLDGGLSDPGYFTEKPTTKYTVSFSTDGTPVADIEVDPGDSITTLPTTSKADHVFDGWFESASDTNPVTEPYTPSGDITLIAKWSKIICKKATSLNGTTCHASSGSGCKLAGYTENQSITFGNYIDSDTYDTGDALDCDVDGTGYNKRFYYMRTLNGNAVLLPALTKVASGDTHDTNYLYDDAVNLLPTTSEWSNLPVTFDNGTKAGRFPTLEDTEEAIGTSDISSSNSLKDYEFIFEDIGKYDTTSGRSTVWLKEVDSEHRYRYHINSNNVALITGTVSTSKNCVKPVIEVPLRLIEDSYIVKFNANGGAPDLTYRSVKKGTSLGTLPTATKTGYVVENWYTNLSFIEPVTINTIPNGYVTYFAKWVKPVEDMLIDTDTYSLEIGETDSITITDPEEIEPRTYLSNDTSVVTVDSSGNIEAVGEGSTTITITGSRSGTTKTITVTVYAQLTDFTVTFDSQGGSTVEDMTVPINTAIGTLPQDPIKADHTFGGWFTNTNYTTQVTVDTIIRGNVTFFAKWIPNNAVAEVNNQFFTTIQSALDDTTDTDFTVKVLKDVTLTAFIDLNSKNTNKNVVLDLQGHTISVDSNKNTQAIKTATKLEIKNGTVANPTQNGTIDVASGGRLILNDNVRIENTKNRAAIYNSGGTIEIGGDAYLTSNAEWTSNANFKRGTVQSLTGTVNITGGTIINTRSSNSYAVGIQAGTLVIGTEDSLYDTTSLTIQGETGGIYSDVNYSLYDGMIKGKTAAVHDESKITGIETGATKVNDTDSGYNRLYYTLPVSKYKVTLNANGGSVDPTYINVDVGDQVGTLPTPTRGLYTFDGWWTDYSGGTQVTSSYEPTGNVEIIARWHYNSSTNLVSFNMNNNAIETYSTSISSWKNETQSTFQTNMANNFSANSCSSCNAPNNCSNPLPGNQCDKSIGFETGVSDTLNVYESDETTRTKGSAVSYTTSTNGTIYNMIPGETYYWESATDSSIYGVVKATGYRRMINTTVRNVRDLGGLEVDTDNDGTVDGRIKYGKLFRGAELSSSQSDVTNLAKLGIDYELDLRDNNDASGQAKFVNHDNDIEIVNYLINPSTHQANYDKLKDALKFTMNYMITHKNDDKALYFHCTIGTDRTGTLAYFLEGFLGVSEEDRVEDYELSYYFGMTNRDRYHDNLSGSSINPRFTTMHNTYDTNTKIINWFTATDSTQTEIDADLQLIEDFRDAMIE